ncbi:TPA: hypothetical protein N0F65_008586 [Lagenidium giganteum]|uniref:Secreted protein n=1 Tax=Lagenidium giganteum TaxID=4803 RepID=A0AAV2Z1A3_9STRA|nr:TPA: hypothetical protein N0F65_008586 [Lagenidium giganteum]
MVQAVLGSPLCPSRFSLASVWMVALLFLLHPVASPLLLTGPISRICIVKQVLSFGTRRRWRIVLHSKPWIGPRHLGIQVLTDRSVVSSCFFLGTSGKFFPSYHVDLMAMSLTRASSGRTYGESSRRCDGPSTCV